MEGEPRPHRRSPRPRRRPVAPAQGPPADLGDVRGGYPAPERIGAVSAAARPRGTLMPWLLCWSSRGGLCRCCVSLHLAAEPSHCRHQVCQISLGSDQLMGSSKEPCKQSVTLERQRGNSTTRVESITGRPRVMQRLQVSPSGSRRRPLSNQTTHTRTPCTTHACVPPTREEATQHAADKTATTSRSTGKTRSRTPGPPVLDVIGSRDGDI